MELFSIYTTSPLAKEDSKKLMEVRTFCKNNCIEVSAFDKKIVIICGVRMTFTYPKKATAEWLKGKSEKVMSDYKKSNIWKMLHG